VDAAAAMPIDWKQPFAQRFRAAMDDDFGTPDAVAVLFDLASEVNRSKDAALAGLLRSLGGTLGLLQADPMAYLQAGGAAAGVLDEAQIQEHIAARVAAKQAKNFTEADRIRQLLLAQGVVLKDGPAGTSWERA
jgi:cysteinyl-tRNA synthetase